ncbi:MAG: helix-turn-helix transcriptional regulator [bacterium]
MKKIYIAWQDTEFTIEWYFTAKGESPALEYFENLTKNRKKKLTSLFITITSLGKIFNKEKFRSEGDQIYAFKKENIMNKKTKVKTTCGEFLKSLSPKERKLFEKEHKEFLISEMLIAAMQKDDISVRKLAELAGVSSAIVQSIRAGTQKNITLKTLYKIVHVFGYSLALTKDNVVVPIDIARL